MTTLTAYNTDVQRFFRGAKCTKIRKETIISTIEEKVIAMNKSFRQLFPNKKLLVLDEIIFLLSGTGICTIGAEKLAEKAGCSVRTVYSTVNSIKVTDELLVCQLANNNAGKYIFVLKSHPNFQQILKEVFFIDEVPEVSKNNEIAEHVAGHFAGLENPESLGAVGSEVEKQSLNHINQISLKQERDTIRDSIEYDINSVMHNREKTREKIQKEYLANEWQLGLFDLIMDTPFPSVIKEVAGVLVLIAGNNCDNKRMLKAYQLVTKIAVNMSNGVQIDNVKAVFREGIDKPLDRYTEMILKKMPITTPESKANSIELYNWLEIRG